MTFESDSPGTVRRSVNTGTFLIRSASGWIAISPDKEWGHHYSSIGCWDGRDDIFPLYPVQKVG